MPRGHGTTGSVKLGMTDKVDSDQYRNLYIHVPFADRQQPATTTGSFPFFRDRKRNAIVKTNDPSNYGRTTKHPTRGIYVPQSYQWAGGSGQVSFDYVKPDGTIGYNSNNKDFRTPRRFTASIWFRQTAAFVAQYSIIMGEIAPGYDSAGYNWWANWMVRLENNYKPRFYICDGTSANYGEYHAPINSYSLNKDYMLTYTYDGLTVRGYLNSVQVASGTFTFGVGNSIGNLEFASCRQSLFNEFGFNGLFWDFRLYGEALTPAQIQRLYNYTNDLYAHKKRSSYTGIGVQVEQTVTQSFTPSDSIVKRLNLLRTVSHNVTASQGVGTNLAFTKTISQSFSTSQSLGRAFLLSVTQTVSAADVVAFTRNKFYSKTVSQSFATYQDIGTRFARHVTIVQGLTLSDLPQSDLTNIRQSFTVTQVVAFNKIVNVNVTQSFATEQVPFINSPRFLDIAQGFTCSQSVVGRNSTNRQTVSQSFTATDTATGRNATFRLAISQSFTTGYTLYRRDAIIRMSLTDGVTMTHRVNTIWNRRVEQDINIVDTIDAHRHVYRTFSTETTIEHNFDKQRVVARTFSTELTETSGFQRQVIYGRELAIPVLVEHQIVVSMRLSAPQIYLPEIVDGPPAFGVPNVIRPGISGIIPVANLVKLDSGSSTILLPVPQLQNTLGDVAEVVVKRTISGAAQAYKKTTGQQRFTYTFWLDMLKALELRDWIIANGSKEITLTNWRGEAWKGNITTDQPQLSYDALRKGDAIEKVTITLAFQGRKLYG